MNISKIKAVVFDCDGVLFDTGLANRKFYDEVLDRFDKPGLTREQFKNVHMMTVGAAVEYLFPELEDLTPVYTCLKQIGYHKFIPDMKMEDGLVSLLEKIKKRGWVRGIATNRTDTMEKVLKEFHLDPYFDIVVTARDVDKAKPHPDELIKIMDHYDLSPHEMVFLGDSDFDRQAARRAGTWFIAFRQSSLDADVHVDSMDGLGDVLRLNE
ncbi:HAD family hydrolase [Desulfospira joergensenii]|uniref:HAD family hydrolase n=1 Tax=Desulfospira joergensenii TaxID=53329 RepID=UPI0003B596AD|nr:HAD family hydrolase [Desulfospira joergensenii]